MINIVASYASKVSKLDIDDYGSVIGLTKLELKIPANDNSIIQTL
jgi:hypothetical protein